MVLPAVLLGAALSAASVAVSGAPGMGAGDYLYPSCGGLCRPALPRAKNPEAPHIVPAPAPAWSSAGSHASGSLRASANAPPSDTAHPQLR
jgi:hypothetical protein